MANTYTQMNVHAVFAVKGRQNLLTDNFRKELFRYISGILKNNKQFSLAVNGYKDHVHIFFELHPTTSLSDIIRIVKTNSSKWINENNFTKGKFNWQKGYGAFSYSKSQRNNVIKYIMQQEKHHQKQTFREEYFELLEKFEIQFDSKYIFEFYNK
ncbi:MAG: IS200/IS605 family transposase [Chlorobi bacterium]|nr:IS200/IS605 family transposase [Chlorobiota bacterium]